jgi:hypothetical protein
LLGFTGEQGQYVPLLALEGIYFETGAIDKAETEIHKILDEPDWLGCERSRQRSERIRSSHFFADSRCGLSISFFARTRSPTRDRKTFIYYPGQVELPNEAAPRILNKSWTLTADIEVPEDGAEGMFATHGGLVGGYGLYVRDGKPTFVYNCLVLDRFTFAGKEPLPKGKV